ncbi:MAG: TIGR03032 family protein [Bacteroidota bacterium]
MNTPPQRLAPFASQYTPNLPELLLELNCSLAVTTYQAGKILLISPKDANSLSMLPRTFKKAMGIALDEERMAVATKSEVVVLRNVPELAATYPKKPNTYDAMFLPQATYYTGQVDIHDLHWGTDALWAVNTAFSCLCTVDDTYSFTPQWQPHFISKLVSEDRCHLNGLAMQDKKPKYVSALGKGDTFQAWRENITGGGIVMDVPSNEIIAEGLPMPHTPRIWNDELYLLLSAAEKLVKINRETGAVEEIAHVPGFVRGMAKHRDFVFIGTSKLRSNSSTFRHLKIAEKANQAGITVIHLPTAAKVAQLTFQMTVDEIYDIQVIPNVTRPNVLNTYTDTHIQALHTPTGTYWAMQKESE